MVCSLAVRKRDFRLIVSPRGIETDDLLNVSANKSISTVSSIAPGHRGPNAVVSRVGTGEELILSSIIRNGGKFNVVVFTGDPHHTKKALKTLREELGVPREPTALDPYVTFTTLVLGQGIGSGEVMGCQPFGRAYFDHKRQAHEAYGIDDGRGAVLVFRPDGHLGIVLDLAAGHKGLVTYLAGFSGET
jgi:phenol 2-monooxygenase